MTKEKSILAMTREADIGDVILFERNEQAYEGTVYLVRENSVIVDISEEAAEELGYPRPNTVVRHGKYVVLEKSVEESALVL